MFSRIHGSKTLSKLSGLIPIEIAMLTQLTYLSLMGNDLTGSIPSELGLLN